MHQRKTEFEFPESHEPHTDKYFLTSREILQKEDINPFVRYQMFIRKLPKQRIAMNTGVAMGIDKAIAMIMHYRPEFRENGGRIWAQMDGWSYASTDTLMIIEGHIQDIIDLETMYLSIISQNTHDFNNEPAPNPKRVQHMAADIKTLLYNSKFGDRSSIYFGARHRGYEWDREMAEACYKAKWDGCSTDVGAEHWGKNGGGTTPHALALAFAMRYGLDKYAVKMMQAFDKHMPKDVPRVFLADTFNKEIEDTLKVAEALGDKFWGPRFDTNGAVGMQGTTKIEMAFHSDNEYMFGKGVKIGGVLAARNAFNHYGFDNLKIALTSGFSDPGKTAAFLSAERKFNLKLFNFIGAGFSDDAITATSDIVGYYDNNGLDFVPMSKVARPYKPNPRLKRVDLSRY